MLADALEHLVSGIVDHPEDVEVTPRSMRRGQLLEVRVNPEDLGRVIGRGGRTARALRTVMGALSTRGTVRVDVVDTDRESDSHTSRRGPALPGPFVVSFGGVPVYRQENTCSSQPLSSALPTACEARSSWTCAATIPR